MRELITGRIITCWNETGAPLHSDREMYGNPLGAYKQSGGSWTDTDTDRIPDIVEIYFSNTTNIENETMWEEYLSNTTTSSLFQNYAWCREYYHDLNANNSSAAENWTQKAFNPFVSYNLPPMIVQYNVDIQAVGTSAAKISFWYLVRDVQGISEIKVDLIENWTNNLLGEYKIILYPNTPTEYNYSGYFVIGTGTLFLGCELRIKVSNGFNDVSLAKDFDGFGSMFVKALQALGEMLLGGLQKAWEAVQNAVNVIVEWIKTELTKVIEPLFSPFRAQIEGQAKEWADMIMRWIWAVENGSTDTTPIVTILFGNPISLSIFAAVVALKIALFAFLPFTPIMLPLTLVFVMIIMGVLGATMPSRLMEISEVLPYGTDVNSNAQYWAEKTGWAILSLLFSGLSTIFSVLGMVEHITEFDVTLVAISIILIFFSATLPVFARQTYGPDGEKAMAAFILVISIIVGIVSIIYPLVSYPPHPVLVLIGVILWLISLVCAIYSIQG